MKSFRLASILLALAACARAQTISVPPQNQSVAAAAAASFTVTAAGSALSYQWQRNGTPLAGATSATLALPSVAPADAGIYTVVVTSGASSVSASAILGVTTTEKFLGTASVAGSNIVAPNGNIYDQFLLTGAAATITADPGQVARISYLDLDDDIVQVEFSGAGALTITLDSASGPAPPVLYNQPSVSYMKGHAHLIIAGADASTNVLIFTVGTQTAFNPVLFKDGVTYDGIAGLASLAVVSADGHFGGARCADAFFYATAGLTGIDAPGVQFAGPVYAGEINAYDSAAPVLLLGAADDVRVTGGSLLQANAAPVAVSGFTHLAFVDGTNSAGVLIPAKSNLARLVDNGVDVTAALLGLPSVTLTASIAAADNSGAKPGEFTFTRTGDLSADLVVSYSVGGSAENGSDYQLLPGTITIPAGAASAALALSPNPSLENAAPSTATLTLLASPAYLVGSPTPATVTITSIPATLYLATLRPSDDAASSTASGTATILLSASGTLAGVNVSFSNLSSAEVTAHLVITPADDYVFPLALGQVTGADWRFTPTGNYTAADLLAALKAGNISVRVDTAAVPAGELRGPFVQSAGSTAFTAPAAPPAVSLTNVTATDAARFLTQATFGPTRSEIDALTGGSISAWLDAQLALPFTSQRAALLADYNAFGGLPSNGGIFAQNRLAAWWKTVLTAPDQLRQRVAFALSELFVVSDVSLGQPYTEGLANYYDVLGRDAFGNFRQLLTDVTLSPIMGNYLSSLRNAKADPVAGTSPDENYAREVMQLFTIGLNKLQPDGTLVLDDTGLPVPTYDQTTVTEMAKVFTGWAYPSTNPNAFKTAHADFIDPMQLYPAYHDDTEKHIVNDTTLPAGQGGDADLAGALDALFNDPNTGPFVCRQLIQRLVTSNPSPAYVYRVAQVFADDGTGTRGNLAAVVRAILTDYEARSPDVAANTGFGKLKEPLLRATALLRGFAATPKNGRYSGTLFFTPDEYLAEAPLRSPTVFNFFHPDYVLPGPLAAAGLVAPEFEITSSTYAVSVPNYLRSLIFTNANSAEQLDLSAEQSLAATPTALVDHLNLVLCSGHLPAAAEDSIVSTLSALPTNTSTLERAETAVLLVATSPAAAMQK